MKDKLQKLWGGRFQEATDAFVEAFTASVGFDQTLALYDIEGSIAHATMLQAIGVIDAAELEQVKGGLEAIAGEIAGNSFPWSVSLEDVHTNIDQALIARIGATGKKLHTVRSRHD